MNVRNLTCERCAKPLACGVDQPGGCWCMGLPLTPALRASIARSFDDCLCGDCLRELAAQEKAGAEDSGRLEG